VKNLEPRGASVTIEFPVVVASPAKANTPIPAKVLLR
jgi:hypothetical protein